MFNEKNLWIPSPRKNINRKYKDLWASMHTASNMFIFIEKILFYYIPPYAGIRKCYIYAIWLCWLSFRWIHFPYGHSAQHCIANLDVNLIEYFRTPEKNGEHIENICGERMLQWLNFSLDHHHHQTKFNNAYNKSLCWLLDDRIAKFIGNRFRWKK